VTKMCLAVPMMVTGIENDEAMVELSGVRRRVSIVLISDQELHSGDYVLVHAGFALEKIDEHDAKERLQFLEEAMENNQQV